MNLYEHTIIARQDASPAQIKSIKDKYENLIKKTRHTFSDFLSNFSASYKFSQYTLWHRKVV